MTSFLINYKKFIRENIILIIIITIFLFTYLYIKFFSYQSKNILIDYAKKEIINKTSNVVNKSIDIILANNDFDDLIIVNKNGSGIIEEINFSNAKTNKILYYSTNSILDHIKLIETSDNSDRNLYYVPFGVIFNTPLFSNFGPLIPFKVKMIGSLSDDININVKEYGINSFLIQLLLSIEINMEVILPFKTDVVNIHKDVILDSKIIQGQIPKYYGGISRE